MTLGCHTEAMPADLGAADWVPDPETGLPRHALDYRPDTSIYDRNVELDGPPAWLDELDLRTGPPYQHVGTHAASPAAWLLADRARDMELGLRTRLLDERRGRQVDSDVQRSC